MGQYYTPVIIKNDKIKTLCCYDYDNGAKLMEHSYLRNNFTEAVVKQLIKKPSNLAWVGDYAEPEDNNHPLAEKFLEARRNAEEYYVKPKIGLMESSYGIIFINHTKKEYFYMNDYIKVCPRKYKDMVIHPLPLLTAIGNGKGGGDYRGWHEDLVGRWACDEIEANYCLKEDIYKRYKNITSMLVFFEG